MTAPDFILEPIDPALDRGYNARESVLSFEVEYARYVAASDRVKAERPPSATLVHDAASGETLDLYLAAPVRRSFSGSMAATGGFVERRHAFVVPGLLDHGISVAVMNYTLAPTATLDEIVRQTRTALAFPAVAGERLRL